MNASDQAAKMLLKELGAEIRRHRERLAISQSTVARLADVHVNVIGRTERGTHNPTILTLDSIATALDTSLADLLRERRVPKRRRRAP